MLVGKFTLRRANFDVIQAFFGKLKLSSLYSICLLDSRHMAIQHVNDMDYSGVFS